MVKINSENPDHNLTKFNIPEVVIERKTLDSVMNLRISHGLCFFVQLALFFRDKVWRNVVDFSPMKIILPPVDQSALIKP